MEILIREQKRIEECIQMTTNFIESQIKMKNEQLKQLSEVKKAIELLEKDKCGGALPIGYFHYDCHICENQFHKDNVVIFDGFVIHKNCLPQAIVEKEEHEGLFLK